MGLIRALDSNGALCRVCKAFLPPSSFGKLNGRLAYECKPCKSEIDKAYRLKHKEALDAKKRAYYLANAERLREKSSAHYHSNKPRIAEYSVAYRLKNIEKITTYRKDHYWSNVEYYKANAKAFYENNRDHVRVRSKIYRSANLDRLLSNNRAYYNANRIAISKRNHELYKVNGDALRARRRQDYAKDKPKYLVWKHARRARFNGAPGRFTKEYINRLIIVQRGLCACCRVKFGNAYRPDHIIPLVRGGTNYPDNIQLLCDPCNSRKQGRDPLDFMQDNGYLL